MKQLLILPLSCIIMLFAITSAHCQQWRLVINNKEEKPVETFEKIDDKATIRITKDILLKGGWQIQLEGDAKDATVKFASIKGENFIIKTPDANKYNVLPLPKEITSPMVIELIKGGKTSTVNLNFQEVNESKENNDEPFVCPQLLIVTSTCTKPSRVNMFNEDPFTYTKNKVVYVLDFDPKIQEQNLYKIYAINADVDKEKINKRGKSMPKDRYWKMDEAGKAIYYPPADSLVLVLENLQGSKETLKAKQNIQFKIFNVNKFEYDVSVSDTLVKFASEPPFLFRQMFLGDSAGFLGTLFSTINSASGIVNLNKDTTSTFKSNLNAKINCFFEHYNFLQNEVIVSTSKCQEFSCCPKYKNLYSTMANQLLDIRVDIAAMNGASGPSRKLLTESEAEYKRCKDASESLESKKKVLSALVQAGAKAPEIEAAQKEVTALEKRTAECKIPLDKLVVRIDSLKKLLEPYAGLEVLQSKFPTEAEIQKLMLYVNSMTQHSQQFVKTIPQLRGARLKLDVAIAAKDSVKKYSPSTANDSYKIPLMLPIIRGWNLGFSTGSFIGINIDGKLQPKTYAWRGLSTGNDSESYQLVEAGYERLPIGFSALANLQYQMRRNLSIGPSVGVGLTIEKIPRPVYLGGISLSVGEERQLIFTAGALLTRVNVLNASLSANTVYPSNEQTLTYQDHRVGAFFSVTFTPFKVKPL